MSNTPPTNVPGEDSERLRPLASGFDTLHLAVDVRWQDDSFLTALHELKREAADSQEEQPLGLVDAEGTPIGPLNVKPHGVQGYEWLLTGCDYNLRVGNWLEPRARPSVMLEVGSEPLWGLGHERAVMRPLEALQAQGAEIVRVKGSRVDACLDLLLPAEEWSDALLRSAVTRARKRRVEFSGTSFSGLSLGHGNVLARLYDKPLEIRDVSPKKRWMYEVWGIKEVPAGFVVARVEFQLRREAIRLLGLDSIGDVFEQRGRLWAYCTEKWLQFKDGAGQQHHLRETLPWWEVVQRSFTGAQPGNPLLRQEAAKWEEKQLQAEAVGFLSSLAAKKIAGGRGLDAKPEEVNAALDEAAEEVKQLMRERTDLDKTIRRKIAKHRRGDGRPLRVRPSSATEEKIVEVKEDEPCPF